jgi:hypothetical protein
MPQRWKLLSFRNEKQRKSVIAPAFSSGRGTVLEYMTLVSTTSDAVILGPRQDQLEVTLGTHRTVDGLREAGPSGPALVLVFALEQREMAGSADEGTLPLFLVQGAGTGRFGVFLEKDKITFAGKQFPPIILALVQFRCIATDQSHGND